MYSVVNIKINWRLILIQVHQYERKLKTRSSECRNPRSDREDCTDYSRPCIAEPVTSVASLRYIEYSEKKHGSLKSPTNFAEHTKPLELTRRELSMKRIRVEPWGISFATMGI